MSYGPPNGSVEEPHIAVGPNHAAVVWQSTVQPGWALYDRAASIWHTGTGAFGSDNTIAYDAVNEHFVAATRNVGIKVHILDPYQVPPGLPATIPVLASGQADKPWVVRGMATVARQDFHISSWDFSGLWHSISTDGGWTWTNHQTGHPTFFAPEVDVALPVRTSPAYIVHPTSQSPLTYGILEVGFNGLTPYYNPLLDSAGQPVGITLVSSCTAANCGLHVPGPFPVRLSPHLSADPTDPDTLYVVFMDADASNASDMDVFCVKVTRTSGAWTAGSRVRVNNDVSTPEHDSVLPDLAVDAAGRVHVVFYDDRAYAQGDTNQTPKFDVWYAYSLDGGANFTNQKLAIPTGEPALDFNLNVWSGVPKEYPGIATFGNEVWAVYAGTSTLDTTSWQSVIYLSRITH